MLEGVVTIFYISALEAEVLTSNDVIVDILASISVFLFQKSRGKAIVDFHDVATSPQDYLKLNKATESL